MEVVLDLGATSHMIKDRTSFVGLDKEYSGRITNVNNSK